MGDGVGEVVGVALTGAAIKTLDNEVSKQKRERKKAKRMAMA